MTHTPARPRRSSPPPPSARIGAARWRTAACAALLAVSGGVLAQGVRGDRPDAARTASPQGEWRPAPGGWRGGDRPDAQRPAPPPRAIGSRPNADVPDARRPTPAPSPRPPAVSPSPISSPGQWREPTDTRTPRWGQTPPRDHWRGDRFRDPWYHDRGWPVRRPYGHVVTVLPPYSHSVIHAGRTYWYADGYWYAPGGAGYIAVQPPPGLYVSTLIGPYTAVRVGPHVYYHAYGVYYMPLATGGYQVVPPPAEAAVLPVYEPPLAYPKRGQSAQQQSDDEYECHRWSVEQTGYDPTLAAVGQEDADDQAVRDRYTRALTACLEGRGYAVR